MITDKPELMISNPLDEDPLYLNAGKEFLNNGGMAYNNALIRNTEGNLEYVPARGAKASLIGMSAFCLVFAIISSYQLAFGGVNMNQTYLSYIFSVMLPLGLVYLFYTMYLNVKKVVVFNKVSGFFYKGIRKGQNELFDMNTSGYVSLSRIHALQILSCPKIRRSGKDYQINLVLNDGSRTNVSNYSFQDDALKDADMIGKELGIPVWDLSQINRQEDDADLEVTA